MEGVAIVSRNFDIGPGFYEIGSKGPIKPVCKVLLIDMDQRLNNNPSRDAS